MRLSGPSYHQITEQIYVGGLLDPDQWPILAAEGVTVDMNLQNEAQDWFEGEHPEVYLWLPVPDWAGPKPAAIHTGVRLLHPMIEEGRKVYIHCFAGVGRSPIMAAGYLVSTGMTSKEALAYVKEKRPPANPLDRQIRYLRLFEQQWRDRRL